MALATIASAGAWIAPTLDEARRGAVKSASVPELVEAGLRSRSAGQSGIAPPENHYRGPSLSSSSICVGCDLELDVVVQLWLGSASSLGCERAQP